MFGFISAEKKICRNQDQKELWMVHLDWPPTCYMGTCSMPKNLICALFPSKNESEVHSKTRTGEMKMPFIPQASAELGT